MTGRKRIGALVAAAAAAITLAACGGAGGAGAPPLTQEQLSAQSGYNPQPYENLKDGGTLTTAIAEINSQFNVFQADSTNSTRVVWNWYNPLIITFTAEGKSVYNPDYLTDVKTDNAGGVTKTTYTINPKAAYNDGSPIDWTAFEATWKANNGKDAAYSVSSTDGYDRIASVTRGVDDRQAVVTYTGINLWYDSLFNNLVNPKALTPDAFNKGYIDTPHNEWGAGPYQIQKYDKQNGTIVFERNPKWWGKPGKLDTRTILQMEYTAETNAMKNGQLDAARAGTRESYSQLKGLAGTDLRKGPSLQVDFFQLNGTAPLLSDPVVRKAILSSIDRKQIGQFHFNGLEYEAEPVGSMNLLPFQEGYSDDLGKVIQYNPEQAKKDLDAAGWVPGPDGIRVKNGQKLQISYVNTGDDATGKAISAGTQAMLKAVGVQMDVRNVPDADFAKILAQKQFDMFYSGAVQSDPYGIAYICQLFCSNTQFLRTGVNDPKNDALIQSVNTLPTPEEQYKKASEAQIAAFGTYGVLPTVALPQIVVAKTGLANYGATRFFTTSPENVGWQK